MAKKYNREELIEKMKDYYEKFGYPKTREFNKNKNYPNLYTYRKEFGSFQNALSIIGIELTENQKKLCNRKKYSKEELLNIFKYENSIYLYKTGELLKDEIIDNIKTMPSASTYYKNFKTLDNVFMLIGINRNAFYNDKLEEDMKNKYIKIRNIIGKVPTSRDLDKFSRNDKKYYGATTYLNHFESIEKLNILMGDTPYNYSRIMTDNEMLEGLIRLKEEMGIVPTQTEVKSCDYCGSISDYSKRFGSFVKAIEKAGMIPRSNKKELITPKGNKALSGYEYKFMLVLEQYGVDFKKEEFYKSYIKDFNKNYRFDFTLNINGERVFVEIFGITDNKNYYKKTEEKIQLCKDNDLKLIELYPDDVGKNSFEDIYNMIINMSTMKGNDE